MPQQLEHLNPNEDSNPNLIDELDSWDPMGEEFRSAENTLAVDPSDPVSVFTGNIKPIATKIGDVIICEHYAKFGHCADGFYCDRIHIDPKKRNFIWHVQQNVDQNRGRICLTIDYLSPQIYLPDPNVLLLITLTRIANPSLFYFVAPYENANFKEHETDDINFHIQHVTSKSEIKRKIQNISDQLFEMFGKHYRYDNIKDTIYLGQIVACKRENGAFARAMVLSVPETFDDQDNEQYNLLLLDNGVEIRLPREAIFDIKAQCLSEPPLAVNCRLPVKPINNKKVWSKEVVQDFRFLTTQDEYLLCKIIDEDVANGQYIVDLFNIKSRQSLTEILINEGLVERTV